MRANVMYRLNMHDALDEIGRQFPLEPPRRDDASSKLCNAIHNSE